MNDFTSGNVPKQIIMFTLPMLIGNIFQQMYSMADAWVVGRYVGGSSMAAVGISAPVTSFLLSVLIGLTTGASVLISQLYGMGKRDELKRAVSTSAVFLAALVLVVGTVGFFGSPFILRSLDVPEDIFAESLGYLRIVMTGLAFQLLYNMYSAYLRALGDSRVPLYFLIFSTLLNIGLDFLFVAGFGMGVDGAAYATVISQAAAAVVCLIYAWKRAPLLRISLIFDRPLFRAILKYSIPSALQLAGVSLASLTIQRLVNSFGSVSIAGYTAATKIDTLATMPLSNISMAVSTFVAQNMGAGKEERAKKGFRSALLLMLGFGAVVSLFAILLGKPLIQAFVSADDPNVAQIIAVGSSYLSIIALCYSFFSVLFAFTGFFRGTGDAFVVMLLLIASLTIRSVSAHILVSYFGMGPEAVAASIPIGWATCSLAAFVYYKKRLWAGKMAIKG